MLESKTYIVESVDEDGVKLVPFELLESSEAASALLSSCRDEWRVQIDYSCDYCGYDEDEDSYEMKQVSYTLGELLEERACVGCVVFGTAAFALRSGAFYGAIIEVDGGNHLLTVNTPVTVSAEERTHDHREYSTRATFTLVRSEG